MMTPETAVRHTQPQAPSPAQPGQHYAVPLLRFEYRKSYDGIYSNRHDKFVLREEHIAELKRLVQAHNKEHVRGIEPLSMSDIVNAALDFAFEHPLAFHSHVSPSRLRETLGREVYRTAFLHFARHAIL